MLPGLLLMIIGFMRLFPDTPFARFLHRHLVEQPLRWIATVERHQLIFVGIMALLLLVAGEAIAVIGSSELLIGFVWDLSIYVDALAATYMLAATTRLRTAWHLPKRRIRRRPAVRPATRARRKRTSRRAPMRKPATNDDDPAPPLRIAA